MTSTEKTTTGLLRVKLSLYRQSVVSIETFNSFGWWAEHEQQFPNITFLARQILGIIGLYIETERIFSMAEIIIGLKHYCLGIENLDKLILIMKNWPDDPRLGCVSGPLVKSMEEYLDFEDFFLEKNEELFFKSILFEED
jgi:hypothetical protein